MKVRTLLLVAVTLVVSAQSYGNIKKQRGSLDPNISKNITGPTNNNSEECPFQAKIAKNGLSNAKNNKIAQIKGREENR